VMIARATVARTPGAPRRPRISRNTIAQGVPAVPAALCYLRARKCISFARKARGCGQHPALPAPSRYREGRNEAKLGQIMPREGEVVFSAATPIPPRSRRPVRRSSKAERRTTAEGRARHRHLSLGYRVPRRWGLVPCDVRHGGPMATNYFPVFS
jgi:hypothetical protein